MNIPSATASKQSIICHNRLKARMKSPVFLRVGQLIVCASVLVGCRAAHNVAVTSFRVIDAPANYIRRHIDSEAPTNATYQSDVTNPGAPVAAATPTRKAPSSRREVSRSETEGVEDSSSTSQTASASEKIPYAKPVPGKPGYVYSPFDPNGGYVDVTGYAAGSKAKDPYSGKIFIVP